MIPFIRKIALFMTATCILLLFGCTELEKPQYNYIPPASYAGMECVNSCIYTKSAALQTCQFNATYCKQKFMYAEFTEKNSGEWGCDNDKRSCTKQVEDTYHQCYQSCGGQVKLIKPTSSNA